VDQPPIRRKLGRRGAELDNYTEAKASLDLRLNLLDGKRPNDAEKVAQLIIDAMTTAEPPLHLFVEDRKRVG